MKKKKNIIDDIVVPVVVKEEPQTKNLDTTQSVQQNQEQINKENNENQKIVLVRSNENNSISKSKLTKKGCMIAGVICSSFAFILSLITVFVYIYLYLGIDTSSQQLNGFLVTISFFIFYGWFTYLPALILAISGLTCSAIGTKSTSKGIKRTCVVFTVFSIIIIVLLCAMFIFSCLWTTLPL